MDNATNEHSNLVSRTLTNGKALVVNVVDAKVVTTIGGEAINYPMVRRLPSPQSTPWGVATHGLGDAGGLKIALSQTEGEAILAAIREQTPKPRNPPCRRCGTHCYGDCTAA